MSGYVEAGYGVVLVSLAGYALSVVSRERKARRRAAGPLLPERAPGQQDEA